MKLAGWCLMFFLWSKSTCLIYKLTFNKTLHKIIQSLKV